MLRWMTPFLVAIFAIGTAAAREPRSRTKPPMAPQRQSLPISPAAAKPADNAPTSKPSDSPSAKPADNPAASEARRKTCRRRSAPRFAPPASCRPACPAPITITGPRLPRRSAALCAPRPRVGGRGRGSRCAVHAGGVEAYAPRVFGTPLLPGSSTLPGYYGTSHSYSYDGPYYGGPLRPVLEPPAVRLRRVRILLNAH